MKVVLEVEGNIKEISLENISEKISFSFMLKPGEIDIDKIYFNISTKELQKALKALKEE